MILWSSGKKFIYPSLNLSPNCLNQVMRLKANTIRSYLINCVSGAKKSPMQKGFRLLSSLAIWLCAKWRSICRKARKTFQESAAWARKSSNGTAKYLRRLFRLTPRKIISAKKRFPWKDRPGRTGQIVWDRPIGKRKNWCWKKCQLRKWRVWGVWRPGP